MTEPTGCTGDAIEALLAVVLSPAETADAVAELRRAGLLSPTSLGNLHDHARRSLQADPVTARRLLEICELEAEANGLPELVPASWYLLARISLNAGDAEAALRQIAAARQRWDELGRPLEAFRTELGRMHVLDEQGRHDAAIRVAEDLLLALEQVPVAARPTDEQDLVNWIRAAALENLGVARGLTGQHERALEAYGAAEALHRRSGDEADEARLRGNRGVALIALGRPAEALAALESAAALFERVNDKLSSAMCSSNAAEAELLLGHYYAAVEQYRQAQTVFEAQGAWPELCRVQIRAVRAYLALNLVAEAEALAEQTCARLETLQLTHDLCEAQRLWADVKLRLGDGAAALGLVDRCLAEVRSVGDTQLLVRALVTRSQALVIAGERAAAWTVASDALDEALSGGWPVLELQARLQLAAVEADDARREQHLRWALHLADGLELPHLRYPVLLELGRHKARHGQSVPAKRWLLAAIDVVEELRWLIPNDTYRLAYFADRTAAYGELVNLLLREGGAEDRRLAFMAAEASKARALQDLLAREPTGGALRHRGARPMKRRLSTTPGDTGLPAPMPAPHEQVVEYHLAEDELVAFVWCNGELNVVRDLPSGTAVAALTRGWEINRRRWQLHPGVSRHHVPQLVATAERSLAELWRAVFQPVERFLDPAVEDLLVVPHGPLHFVPFHALIAEDGPVLTRRTITLAASYGVAAAMEPSRIGPRRHALALGVADHAVPGIVEEVNLVASLLPDATVLLEEEATAAQLSSRCRNHDLLHLACHGRHRPDSPMFSSLQLADRPITAREVLDLDLDRPLVVLSACESGRQSGTGQMDEAIGFARSFVGAGAEAVVVSLWLANDAVARDLMVEFYRELAEGATTATALRTAQIRMAAQHPHPADWAPFVVHGRLPRSRA